MPANLTAPVTATWWKSPLQWITWPLLPEDFLEVINPLWSQQRCRARVISVDRRASNYVTLALRPNHLWQGHVAGQHVRVAAQIEGRRIERTFSIASSAVAASELSASWSV